MQKLSRTEQEKNFLDIVLQNPYVKEIIDSPPFSDGVEWYLAGGCLTQSIWNHISGRPIVEGIEDCDLIYYDASHTEYEAENKHQERIDTLFKHLPTKIDVVNEAGVYLWFEDYFGKK